MTPVARPGARVLVVGSLSPEATPLLDGILSSAGIALSSGRTNPSDVHEVSVAIIAGDVPAATEALSDLPGLVAVVGLPETALIAQRIGNSRGIGVRIVPSADSASVAEHALLMLLMLAHSTDEARSLLANPGGPERNPSKLTTQKIHAFNWVHLQNFGPLFGSQVGLIGYGSIASALAGSLNALGARVSYTKRHRLSPKEELEQRVHYLPLPQLLQVSDYVSIHARFDESNDKLLGARELRLMKPGAGLVNTARGRLLDESALADALLTGHLRGAALDVFRREPLPRSSRLRFCPSVILTPHVAGVPAAVARLAELRCAGHVAVQLITAEEGL